MLINVFVRLHIDNGDGNATRTVLSENFLTSKDGIRIGDLLKCTVSDCGTCVLLGSIRAIDCRKLNEKYYP